MAEQEAGAGSAPTITVVVACVADPRGAFDCLRALGPQSGDAEVLVCSPHPVPSELRASFPEVAFHERRGALVPELWRDGIDLASGELVGLTISPMVPAPDWVATARRKAADGGVVAGAIDPLEDLPLGDLAECLSRYARDMTPFAAHVSAQIPGDNCVYPRQLLLDHRGLWADGFWEPVVNAALQASGVVLRHDPALRVHQGRSAGTKAFIRQRIVHGRANGRQRGAAMRSTANLARVGGAPAIPLLLLARTYRELASRGRVGLRALATLPWLIAYDMAWAFGEARGHFDCLRAG